VEENWLCLVCHTVYVQVPNGIVSPDFACTCRSSDG
jgi:hypothetical protein